MARKLATIQRIDSLEDIPGSDFLDKATINGWSCVVAKEVGHKVGDLVVFCEIDSFCPIDKPYFEWLRPKAIKWQGKEGARIKTMKLRGCLSQGIVLPIYEVKDTIQHVLRDSQEFLLDVWMTELMTGSKIDVTQEQFLVGQDVTEALGIEKWEASIPAQLGGRATNFPSLIRKTDQERIQNMWRDLIRRREQHPDEVFEVTEKLEGSSMTVYLIDGQFGVCSRNWDLVESEENAFWQVANKLGLREKMQADNDVERSHAPPGWAIQGELVGPGVQGNYYGLSELEFRVFDIWNTNDQAYIHASYRQSEVIPRLGLTSVPFIEARKFDFETIQDALAYADGKSLLNPKVNREGVVFKSEMDPNFSFKIVSNKYLLAEKD